MTRKSGSARIPPGHGTLLRSDATLGDPTVKILTELIGQGLLFSYATARSHLRASAIMARLPLRVPVAVYGGSMVVDVRSGAPISISSLDPDTVGWRRSSLGRNCRAGTCSTSR